LKLALISPARDSSIEHAADPSNAFVYVPGLLRGVRPIGF
jgi:hypothetical protein